MEKQRVVLFEEGKQPRIYINPRDISELYAKGTVLIDPKIPKGSAPHEWELEAGQIITPNKKQKFFEKEEEIIKGRDWFKVFCLAAFVVIFTLEVYRGRDNLKSIFSALSSSYSKMIGL